MIKFVISIVCLFCTVGISNCQTKFIFNTGFTDVACTNGTCFVPVNNSVAVFPQSTFFFGASNPQLLQFRLHDTGNSIAIITVDSNGNNNILNYGINRQFQPRSRGQNLFQRSLSD